jgi:multidrug efflux pump subunit AcrB
VQLPEGTGIEVTSAATAKVEAWLKQQPEAKNVVSFIGQGAARFFLAYNPELPDPSFAKIIVLTPSSEARDVLKWRLRQKIAEGLAAEARVRATQFVFGPPSPFPVAFRVMGPDLAKLREISQKVAEIMRANPHMRDVNTDWTERTPSVRFTLDQDRLRLIGLSPNDVSQQLQFLLTGVTVTGVREDIRTVQVMARSAGPDRLDPTKLGNLVLQNNSGQLVPLSQIGQIEVVQEDPILKRRDRTPTITVQGDIDENMQPPPVSLEVEKALQPLIASLPDGYRIEMGGNIEEASKANDALIPVFPLMFVLTLIVIIVQVRSFSAMWLVVATAPLGLIGVVPTLLMFNQPFGFNAILGLIGLSGILMRNTLILIEQIKSNKHDGLDDFHAVVEATVQRARPVVLTAMAAVLAFIPLTTSVFWGSMAYTLIGGTAVGTFLILLFLPALYAIWFRVRPTEAPLRSHVAQALPAT